VKALSAQRLFRPPKTGAQVRCTHCGAPNTARSRMRNRSCSSAHTAAGPSPPSRRRFSRAPHSPLADATPRYKNEQSLSKTIDPGEPASLLAAFLFRQAEIVYAPSD
jgi:hypothetical protein